MFPTKSGNVRAHLAQLNFKVTIQIEMFYHLQWDTKQN